MNKPLNLVERLAGFRLWAIFTLGIIATALGFVAVGLLAQLGYDNLPLSAWTPLIIGHLAGTAVAAWVIPKPFIDAYLLKTAQAHAELHSNVRSLFPDVDE